MSFRIVEPGLCSLIVDGGRPRTRSLGVPCGGPADESAFVLGNALLGNPAHSAALEITLAGPVLQALDSTGVAVVGAPVSLSTGRQNMPGNRSFTLEAGEELHFGGIGHGARAYLCVSEGFQTPEVLGSRCSMGPVRRDDILHCAPTHTPRRLLRHEFDWPQVPALSPHLYERTRMLRVIPGPEADWFPNGGREICEASPAFTVTVRPESNRMGLRLAGPALPVPPREMVSQPMAPGALQVTREGQLILLGVDGQTIGGYPRIAHVISADLDLVGQLRPGDQVTFERVSLTEAEQHWRAKRDLMKRWRLRLQEAAAGG
jgi:5-oxoprolinase (ATP-hydrolysing) subunit C